MWSQIIELTAAPSCAHTSIAFDVSKYIETVVERVATCMVLSHAVVQRAIVLTAGRENRRFVVRSGHFGFPWSNARSTMATSVFASADPSIVRNFAVLFRAELPSVCVVLFQAGSNSWFGETTGWQPDINCV